MIVRAVQIHEAVAELREHGERGGAAVDELPVRARCGKDALHDELAVFAALDALFIEPRVQFRRVLDVKERLDRAAIGTGADERFIRALAEHEFERADDDAFAGARLACDRDEAGANMPFQLLDEGEIADAK